MIALTLDRQLLDDERAELEEAVGEPVEVRRVPWLVRVGSVPDAERLAPHLRAVGVPAIPADERVLLVAPQDLGWTAALSEALYACRGSYPLLVQTEQARRELGEPGPLRVLDMEAYLRDDDAAVGPPWGPRPGPDDEEPEA